MFPIDLFNDLCGQKRFNSNEFATTKLLGNQIPKLNSKNWFFVTNLELNLLIDFSDSKWAYFANLILSYYSP